LTLTIDLILHIEKLIICTPHYEVALHWSEQSLGIPGVKMYFYIMAGIFVVQDQFWHFVMKGSSNPYSSCSHNIFCTVLWLDFYFGYFEIAMIVVC
jgi:hypothetical protein